MSRTWFICSLLILLSAAVPTAAHAAQRTDPDASSPAGVIYEIPFDAARKDSTPKRDSSGDTHGTNAAATAGATGGGSGSGSSRSGGRGAGGGSSTVDSGAQNGTGDGSGGENIGTSIHSENGFGSSSIVPGVAGAPAITSRDQTAGVGGGPSPSFATFGLLALVSLIGTWIGVAASRGLRS